MAIGRRIGGIEDTPAGRLRAARLRPTLISLAVVNQADAMRGQFSPEEVFVKLLERDIRTSVGSVYRVLNALATAGVLSRRYIPGAGAAKVLYGNRDATRTAITSP